MMRWLRMQLALLACWAASGLFASDQTGATIHPDQAHAWGHQIGWVHWRPDPEQGARLGEFVCSGYLYSANTGWIHLGDGHPENGIFYRNDSASDYGINQDQFGNLRGFAYGANIGWIHFEETGAPRIDLQTGRLEGAVYGANVGWITLSSGAFAVQTEYIAPGADSDGDGIPDAWELLHANDLDTFGPGTDADGDGATDFEEYLAGTDPFDPEDFFAITAFELNLEQHTLRLTYPTQPTRAYQLEISSDLNSEWSPADLPPQFGDGEFMSQTLTNAAPPLFFQVKALRPLAP